MKKTFASLFLAFLSVLVVAAKQVPEKAVINVITYDAQGNVLRSGYGFYVLPEGVAVAAYHLFEGAVRADIIDSKGKKTSLRRILGASSTQDLVKFSVEAPSVAALSISAQPAAESDVLALAVYAPGKKDEPVLANVTHVAPYDNFCYYDVSLENTEKNIGCPLLSPSGEVVAIVQKNVEQNATTACAIDARFVNELQITTKSFFNADLRNLAFPKGLPEGEEDALSYIYMLGHSDSLMTLTAINDFIARYPDNPDIYAERGSFHADHGRCDLAEQDYAAALEKSAKKDAVHYAFSKTIFNRASSDLAASCEGWSVDRAIDEANQAYAIDPNPLYALQRGRYRFAKGDYQKAYEDFMIVNSGELVSPETFFSAAKSLEMSGGDSLRVLALLDSAVVRLPQPYAEASAPYFLERAVRRVRTGLPREAVADYNEYEKLIGPKNLTARFYYLREQAERQGRMYQQALDDIQTAISLSPKEVFFRIEEASIYLQVGMFKEALASGKKALEGQPDNPNCYKIMGIACGELKDKANAVAYLKKAQELGDSTAAEFLEKYQ